MLFIVISILFLVPIQCLQLATISNVSLSDASVATVNIMFNLSCHECICKIRAMSFNQTVIGFNCFQSLANKICQVFVNITSSYQFINNPNSRFYFLQFPPIISKKLTTVSPTTYLTTTTSHRSVATTSATATTIEAFWPFDNSTNDLFGTHNGVGVNNIIYTSMSITGYGSALSILSNRTQYVNITKAINLANSSFTFQLWIYIYTYSYTYSDWLGIFGQCVNQSTNLCLQMGLVNQTLRLNFYNNDCAGSSVLNVTTWYHLSFVYDYEKREKFIYLNGMQDGFQNSSNPLLVVSHIPSIVIGKAIINRDFYFNGILDQVYFVNRAKNSSEVLRDATLIVEYSFDGSSSHDSGPNKINGSNVNASYTTTGRVNEALLMPNSSNHSYFLVPHVVLLGVASSSYSIVMWLRPSITNTGGLIVYLDAKPASNWCMSILSLTSTGNLFVQYMRGGSIHSSIGPIFPAGIWTHVAYIYSTTNVLWLYVNGALAFSASSFQNSATNTSVNVILGNCGTINQCNCTGESIVKTQYYGAIDEFQVYSRALSSDDIQTLLNP